MNNRDFHGWSLEGVEAQIAIHGSIRAMGRYYDIPESSIRRFLKLADTSSSNTKRPQLPVATGNIHAPDRKRRRLTGQRFVFTSAQNNTLVHEDFLSSLFHFCNDRDADLIISRYTYNKSGFQNVTKDSGDKELWYDERLHEFLCDESLEVADDLIFCGELDILPTASNPLNGFESYAQGNSAIIPHAKVNLQSLPRLKGEDPRFLYSTGTVTLRNYIQRKAGQKAEFHHVFGALYVEVDEEGTWFARQLISDNNGVFYDLTDKYAPEGVSRGHHAMAINYGDIHVEKADAIVSEASWGSSTSLAAILRPAYQFIHDLTDFSARNHHNIKDPHFLAKQYWEGQDEVEAGLTKSAHFLELLQSYGLVVVVESNHDQAYQRWLKEADIRYDPLNAEFFHRSNARLHLSMKDHEKDFSVYEWALRSVSPLLDTIFLREDDSFVICNDAAAEESEGRVIGGIECGMHGHRGPNGARGNPRQFKTVGRRVNLGHTHSAWIGDGVYVAGVSGKLDMDYNKGPSSWSHTHIVTYQNGKRSLVTIKNGKWRA